MNNQLLDTGDSYIFECPHCKDMVEVLKTETHCRIFRHAYHFEMSPPTIHTYTKRFKDEVTSMFDCMLLPPKATDRILNFAGELPKYILTQPINPHMPKNMCDALVAENKVLGCAKPFRLILSGNTNYVEPCDYI